MSAVVAEYQSLRAEIGRFQDHQKRVRGKLGTGQPWHFSGGDRVITTKDLSGVRTGTKGVIVGESWGRYEVDFGDGRTRDVREDEIAKVSK